MGSGALYKPTHTKLGKWIDKFGADKLATTLNVTKSNVLHWRRGNNLPSTAAFAKIISLSKGYLTYKEVIETFLKNKSVTQSQPLSK